MTYRINQTNKTTNPKIKSPTLQPETANATDLVCGFGCSCDITTSLRPPSLSLRFFVFLAIVNYLSSESGVSCSSRNIKIGCHADIICLLIFIKSTQFFHSRLQKVYQWCFLWLRNFGSPFLLETVFKFYFRFEQISPKCAEFNSKPNLLKHFEVMNGDLGPIIRGHWFCRTSWKRDS